MLKDSLLQLWAKKDKTEHEIRYPLLYHSVDVAMVTQQIWNKSLHSWIRHFLVDQLGLTEEETRLWLPFWVGLHDIGKAAPSFQGKSQVANDLLWPHLSFPQSQQDVPHGTVAAAPLPQYVKSHFEPEGLREELAKYTRQLATMCWPADLEGWRNA